MNTRPLRVCIDPGHGMGNKRSGKFDSGTESAGVMEAAVVMDWANDLMKILQPQVEKVIRTRVDHEDPAPVWRRDDIARSYRCDIMISLHCNDASPSASGSETFYRGADDKAMAEKLTAAVCATLGTKNRGAKTEQQSQHSSLAVLEFDKCWLIEIGFLSNPAERQKMLDANLRRQACEALAKTILEWWKAQPAV